MSSPNSTRKRSRAKDQPAHMDPAISESVKKWTAEDDVLLMGAVSHLGNLKLVHGMTVNLSKKFSLHEIEERWYDLMYNDAIMKTVKKRVETLTKENIRDLQSKIPFSIAEENVVMKITSTTKVNLAVFEDLLVQNPTIFHISRTAKVLQEFWTTLFKVNCLIDQTRACTSDSVLERQYDISQLRDDTETSIQTQSSSVVKNVVANRRTFQDWEKVRTEIIEEYHLNEHRVFDLKSLKALLKGKFNYFLIRDDKVIIGRKTPNHSVDVDLSLEGPSGRISRHNAIIKREPSGEWNLQNTGSRTIYIDSKPVLTNEVSRIIDGSYINIAYIGVTFLHGLSMENELNLRIADSDNKL
uniref:FHA domain-containing protein n=1 Tax=Rhabditophanes sp. KR3021 TaxID=114890 RepID=A0AC35TNX1_9BILA